MVRRVVIFSGRVQGVFFRATAKRCAGGHPVTGWVRNESDGSVRMEVQGDAPAVEGALADLRRAKASNIEREDVSDVPLVEDEGVFEIRR